MSVMLSNRATGHAGFVQCPYGCCGPIADPKNKKSIRKIVRNREKREVRRSIRNGDM